MLYMRHCAIWNTFIIITILIFFFHYIEIIWPRHKEASQPAHCVWICVWSHNVSLIVKIQHPMMVLWKSVSLSFTTQLTETNMTWRDFIYIIYGELCGWYAGASITFAISHVEHQHQYHIKWMLVTFTHTWKSCLIVVWCGMFHFWNDIFIKKKLFFFILDATNIFHFHFILMLC